jgi:hypothetical protein
MLTIGALGRLGTLTDPCVPQKLDIPILIERLDGGGESYCIDVVDRGRREITGARPRWPQGTRVPPEQPGVLPTQRGEDLVCGPSPFGPCSMADRDLYGTEPLDRRLRALGIVSIQGLCSQ